MRLEVQCPNCGHMMEPMPDTEMREGHTRTMDMLCPNCLHREPISLPVERMTNGERYGKDS